MKSQDSLTEQHLFWDCVINGHGADTGANVWVLINGGSHASFICEDIVICLGLWCHLPPQPEG